MNTHATVMREAVAAAIPFSLDSPFGVVQERALRMLADLYFKEAKGNVDRHEAVRIARLALTPEQMKDPGQKVLDASKAWTLAAKHVQPGFEDALYQTVYGVLDMFFEGPEEEAKRDPRFGKKRYRKLGPWPREVRRSAEVWAKGHAGELVEGVTKTDANRIGKIVARGIDKEQTPDQVADEILKYVNDDQMTKERAKAIAMTETNNALSIGAFSANEAAGATSKDWFDLEGSCEICQGNDAVGEIKMQATFPSGHMYPTAHPWCRCFCQFYFQVEPKKKKKTKSKRKR